MEVSFDIQNVTVVIELIEHEASRDLVQLLPRQLELGKMRTSQVYGFY